MLVWGEGGGCRFDFVLLRSITSLKKCKTSVFARFDCISKVLMMMRILHLINKVSYSLPDSLPDIDFASLSS